MDLPNILIFLSFPFTLFGLSLAWKDEKFYGIGVGASAFLIYKLIESSTPEGFLIIPILLFIYFVNLLFKPFIILKEMILLNSILKRQRLTSWTGSCLY